MENELTYPALIHIEDSPGIGISLPDFPGCVTQGDDYAEALANAREALSFHLEGMIEDGETIPEPSRIADIMADNFSHEGFALVSVPDPHPTVRVNITVSSGLLDKIDRAAAGRGVNRSRFLVESALERIRENRT